ncbi:MAG TPA: RNB domain-containing ribonuclease [Terriglobales bacterium]
MNNSHPTHVDLQAMAKQVMLEHGFEPEFPAAVQQQLAKMNGNLARGDGNARDMRALLWSSIDNDTSRDLDQIEVAEKLPDGRVKVMIGIADVDAFVPKACPIDDHAAKETTTVYTGVRIFPMLPEQLSTGSSSLLEDQDRLAIVIEFVVDQDGNSGGGTVYPAMVRNKAQLTYNAIGSWLDNGAAPPPKVAASADLQSQLRLQNEVAQALRKQRSARGALNIDSTEVRPVLQNDQIVDITKQEKNSATDLIEDFMIAANEVVAHLLDNVSSLRRIVRTPERWDRIVQLASQHGTALPADPDSKALNDFLTKQKSADPDRFPDLSLAVIKLMGPGEYILERPGDPEPGHFGLAVQDYTHSTAPNRRFADVVTQRLVKALVAGKSNPYSDTELSDIARNCTEKEDAARKVEREMSKRVSAVAMSQRIGETFDAMVTGVTPHGTFVRVMKPHVEGLLAQGHQGLDVGEKVRVRLTRTDVQRGYIDFALV